MATGSPTQHHNHWGDFTSANLPNVAASPTQSAALEVGDLAYDTTLATTVECTSAVLGAATWQIAGSGAGGGHTLQAAYDGGQAINQTVLDNPIAITIDGGETAITITDTTDTMSFDENTITGNSLLQLNSANAAAETNAGDVSVDVGDGGATAGGAAGGDGGGFISSAGVGGAGDAAQAAGSGGGVTISGGDAGTDGGGGGASGGGVVISSGRSSGILAAPTSVLVGGVADGAAGGTGTVTGGAGDPTFAGGVGSTAGGDGGDALGGAAGGVGGVAITAGGTGGNAIAGVGNTAGTGGNGIAGGGDGGDGAGTNPGGTGGQGILTGGDGGSGAVGLAAGVGGSAIVSGGDGGVAGGGPGGAGGGASVSGGDATGTGANDGGDVSILGGIATDTGTGGDVTITGGTSPAGEQGKVIVTSTNDDNLPVAGSGAITATASDGGAIVIQANSTATVDAGAVAVTSVSPSADGQDSNTVILASVAGHSMVDPLPLPQDVVATSGQARINSLATNTSGGVTVDTVTDASARTDAAPHTLTNSDLRIVSEIITAGVATTTVPGEVNIEALVTGSGTAGQRGPAIDIQALARDNGADATNLDSGHVSVRTNAQSTGNAGGITIYADETSIAGAPAATNGELSMGSSGDATIITNDGSITLDANGALNGDIALSAEDTINITSTDATTVTSGDNINLSCTSGVLNMDSDSATLTTTGIIDIDATGAGNDITIDTSDGSVSLTASGAVNGTVDINAAADVDIDATTAVSINTSAAAADISLVTADGEIDITAGGAVNGTVDINATSNIDIDATNNVTIDSSTALVALEGNMGVTVRATTANVALRPGPDFEEDTINFEDNSGNDKVQFWQTGDLIPVERVTFHDPMMGAYVSDWWTLSNDDLTGTATVGAASTSPVSVRGGAIRLSTNTGNNDGATLETAEEWMTLDGKSVFTTSIRLTQSTASLDVHVGISSDDGGTRDDYARLVYEPGTSANWWVETSPDTGVSESRTDTGITAGTNDVIHLQIVMDGTDVHYTVNDGTTFFAATHSANQPTATALCRAFYTVVTRTTAAKTVDIYRAYAACDVE